MEKRHLEKSDGSWISWIAYKPAQKSSFTHRQSQHKKKDMAYVASYDLNDWTTFRNVSNKKKGTDNFLLLTHEWLIQLKDKGFTNHFHPFKYTCILQGLINLWGAGYCWALVADHQQDHQGEKHWTAGWDMKNHLAGHVIGIPVSCQNENPSSSIPSLGLTHSKAVFVFWLNRKSQIFWLFLFS